MHRVGSAGNTANSVRPRKEKRLTYLLNDGDGTNYQSVNCLSILKSLTPDLPNYIFSGSRDGTLKRWEIFDDVASCSATFESHVDWDVYCFSEGNDCKLWKIEKFEGVNFRRWKKKMHFLLTNLKVVYVLSTPIPEVADDAPIDAVRNRSKWENDDYICRGHILNGMSDPLFDLYQTYVSVK